MEYIGRKNRISTYKTKHWYLHAENKTKALKMLSERKCHELFYVSITYGEVTPESAEHGDFSEIGYQNYGFFCSLKDVMSIIENNGCQDIQNNGSNLTVYGSFYTSDYYTGTERQESIHVDGPKRAIERLFQLLQGDK